MNAAIKPEPETIRDAVHRLFAKELRDGYTIAGCHRYNIADGRELFRMVRLRHPEREKIMRPMHRDGLRYSVGKPEHPASGWPLYVPPYPLMETDPLFIVEGEGCADALAKLGLTAITSGSASSADAADWSSVRNRAVTLWPDNDHPGTGYARAVTAILCDQGCRVQWIAPDVVGALPEHGDCADWIVQHPDATADDVRALLTIAPPEPLRDDVDSVELVSAADVKAEPIRWLWPGWLAKGYPFDPARDVDKLAAALARMGDVALIIIDPLVSAVTGDSHKNAEVRRSLQPLVELAMRLDAALLGITHYSKGTQGREPLERVSGSLAFGALARVVLCTVRMETEGDDAPRRMILARCKSNIGPDGGGFTYAFEQVELADFGGLSASRIAWGAAVEGTARELLAEAEPEGDDKSESGECADWLREELKGGARDAAEMKREGAKLGYSPKVIRRAREKLGVKPHKSAFAAGWVWTPRSVEAAHLLTEDAQDAQQNEVGTFGSNGHLRGEIEVLDL